MKGPILLVDVCAHPLSSLEFVSPIAAIVRKAGLDCRISHYTKLSAIDISSASRVIICGTALADNDYAGHIDLFSWIKTIDKPLLGICAGMQIIGMVFGARMFTAQEIGMGWITVEMNNELFSSDFEAYSLHNHAIDAPDSFHILAKSQSCVQAIMHKSRPFYGVLFHPEVRAHSIVENFCRI